MQVTYLSHFQVRNSVHLHAKKSRKRLGQHGLMKLANG